MHSMMRQMWDFEAEENMSRALHWFGIAIGVVFGTLLIAPGLQALFTLNRNDNVITVVGGLSYSFSLLPAALLGVVRPRLGAYLILAAVSVFLAASAVSAFVAKSHGEALGFNVTPVLLFIVPSLLVSALFLRYSSADSEVQAAHAVGSGAPVPSTVLVDRGRKAKWAAILLGCSFTVPTVPWVLHQSAVAVHRRDWVSACGFAVIALAPIGMSGLAIVNARWAAYGCIAVFIISLIFIFVVWQETSWIAALGVAMVLPLAVMAVLFFLSSSTPQQDRESTEA